MDLTKFSKTQLIELESLFEEQTKLEGYYLQKINEGEGYWLVSTQEEFQIYVDNHLIWLFTQCHCE